MRERKTIKHAVYIIEEKEKIGCDEESEVFKQNTIVVQTSFR